MIKFNLRAAFRFKVMVEILVGQAEEMLRDLKKLFQECFQFESSKLRELELEYFCGASEFLHFKQRKPAEIY